MAQMTTVAGQGSVSSKWDAGWWASGHVAGEGLDHAEDALGVALGRQLNRYELELARELHALYVSEIDVRVRWVEVSLATGGGARSSTPFGYKLLWTCEIGGSSPVMRSGVPLRLLLDWLPSAACRAFPGSEYAKRFPSR